MNSFDHIANFLGNTDNNDICSVPEKKYVTDKELEEWQKQWIFDALKSERLGQSFCNYFNISYASPLYFFKDNNFSMRWINDNYIKK